MNNDILDWEIRESQAMLLDDSLRTLERYAISTYLNERLEELKKRNKEWLF